MTGDIYRDFNEVLLSVFPIEILKWAQIVVGTYIMLLFVASRSWNEKFRNACFMPHCPLEQITLRAGQVGLAFSALIGLAMVIDALVPPDMPRGPTIVMAGAYAMVQTRGAYVAWREHRRIRNLPLAPPYTNFVVPPT